MTISAEYVILADSIRREDNGKFIFVGVYTGDIVLGHPPAPFNIEAYIKLRAEVRQPMEFTITVHQASREQPIARLRADAFETPGEGPVSGDLLLPAFGVRAEGPDEIYFTMKVGDAEETEIGRTRIVLKDEPVTDQHD